MQTLATKSLAQLFPLLSKVSQFFFAQAVNHFTLHLGGFDLLNHFLDVTILSFQVLVHPSIILPLLRKLLLLLLGGRSFTFDAEIARLLTPPFFLEEAALPLDF